MPSLGVGFRMIDARTALLPLCMGHAAQKFDSHFFAQRVLANECIIFNWKTWFKVPIDENFIWFSEKNINQL